MIELQDLKPFILKLAADAGDVLLSHAGRVHEVHRKDFQDVVTDVDRAVEQLIIQRILAQFPAHGIMAEESGTVRPDAEYLWVIDPLDGSAHFARNIPMYSVNIALQHHGKTVLAVINQPTTRQLFFAAAGSGATVNGVPMHVSGVTKLSDAFVYIELPEQKFAAQPSIKKNFSARMDVVEKLVAACTQVETYRIGAFGQCLVAAGAFDAWVDLSGSSRTWDQAASLLIAKEAGAEIIDLDPSEGDAIRVMVTNGKLTKELLTIVRQ
ncbi:MAG: hypothetical protein PHI63_06175 [Patescibacteria group bacterium]|nr:hypothetical protein [Patescibacteria group bacterium]